MTVTPRTSQAKQRMVDTTVTLLRRQGYNGTGLNQIVEESQAPKGSLYHFFPGGKEDLAAEAVKQGAAVVAQHLEMAIANAPLVAEGLGVVVAHIIAELEASDYQGGGCPISTVALETASTSSPLQAACSEAFLTMEQIIERGLLREGRSAEESRALANLILCAYEGALLLSRTHHSSRPLKEMARSMARLSTLQLP